MNSGDFYSNVKKELQNVIHNAIENAGGYDPEYRQLFIHGGDLKQLLKAIKEISIEIDTEFYHPNGERGIWPFCDKRFKEHDKFKEIYFSLEKQILRYRAKDDNQLIEKAGGKPYTGTKYDNGSFGDAVVRPDLDVIAHDLGFKASRSVYRYIDKFVSAGILVRLNTKSNEKGMYIIGAWKGFPGGIRHHRRINSKELRPTIEQGLIELGYLRK